MIMPNESETHKIIDAQLRKVGWEADTENLRYSNGTRPQKGHNIAIAEWQTDSGFVDYALFVGTNMITTIEAKASYKDVSAIIDCQCKDYSRSIRDEDKSYLIGDWRGFKIPFTFATNGRPYCQQLKKNLAFGFLICVSPTMRLKPCAVGSVQQVLSNFLNAMYRQATRKFKDCRLTSCSTMTDKSRGLRLMIYLVMNVCIFRMEQEISPRLV